MILHFISTGSEFPYSYYLAVLSALRTQRVEKVKLWTLEPLHGEYFSLLANRITVREIKVPEFPALEKKLEHFRLTSG